MLAHSIIDKIERVYWKLNEYYLTQKKKSKHSSLHNFVSFANIVSVISTILIDFYSKKLILEKL